MAVDEVQSVFLFRRDNLVYVGFPWDEAVAIAKSEADWHQAIEMYEQGATPELVKEILV